MCALHKTALGNEPTARTLLRYLKDARYATWEKMHAEVDKTLASIKRNYSLRKFGQALGENEGSKLYLFGELEFPPARLRQFVSIYHFSKYKL